IPAVHFSTSGATIMSFFHHNYTHGDADFPFPAIYQRDHEEKDMKARRESIKGKDAAKGIEEQYIDYLSILCQKKRFPAENAVGIDESLPEGFLERVKERGKILQGWAPQTEILAHSNIGGFASHCGWSTVIESIYFAVPLIAMPLKLDQPINARLVVDGGAAMEVLRDDDGLFMAEEVAKAIKTTILEKNDGECLRAKAMELTQKMKNEEEEAMNEAADQLWRICTKNHDVVQSS
ncbi:beta-D-glucosyl crocetin beta-1,6-glucosyltransferase-like, partial [Olea europaea var. sylvestris]|uniref:beta-D-glucosyl crocetin beta-1,6-glucosyltransferase-like n=1 Tax=Olea europaea var. sylvestris TaxID=158386 RepID=UPI000C1D1456